ncbi:MAG: glycosyltransferase family 2 protein [Gaiellaceae bacterium]
MSDRPLVTVAITTYRRPELLRQSLESAVRQTLEEIEIIVSDNGADEETAAVVSSLDDARVAYAPLEENIGLYGNLNRSLRLGTAPYLQILQDDDLLLPASIERKLARIESDPGLAIVHSAHSVIDASGRVLHPAVNWSLAEADWELDGPTFIRRSLAAGVFFHISTALLRRSYVVDEEFEPVGGYCDLGVWLRVASRGGRIGYVHEPLSAIREHASSLSAEQGLHVRRDAGADDGEVDTQTIEQVRQMQLVRRRFLDREGAELPDRNGLWAASRRDARRRLARVIVKDAVFQGSFRRTLERLREARSLEPRIAVSLWPLVALAVAAGGRPAGRAVSFLAARVRARR